MSQMLPSSFLLLFVVLLLTTIPTGVKATWPPSRNSGGWSDVTDQIFYPSGGMYDATFRPAALVDWNGDMIVDLVGLCRSDGNGEEGGPDTVAVALWNSGNHSFSIAVRVQVLFPSDSSHPPQTSPEEPSSSSSAVFLQNAVAGDLDRDGINDIVMLASNGSIWILDGASLTVSQLLVFSNTMNETVQIDGRMPQLSLANVEGRCAFYDILLTTTDGKLLLLKNDLAVVDGSTCQGARTVPRQTWKFVPVWIVETGDAVPMSFVMTDIAGGCDAKLLYARYGTLDPELGFLSSSSTPSSSSGSFSHHHRQPQQQPLLGGGELNTNKTFFVYDSLSGVSIPLFSVPSFVGIGSPIDMDSDGVFDLVFPSCTSPSANVPTGCQDQFDALLIVYASVAGGGSGGVCSDSDCCLGFQTSFLTGWPGHALPEGAARGDDVPAGGGGFVVWTLSDSDTAPGGPCAGVTHFLGYGTVPTNVSASLSSSSSFPLIVRHSDVTCDSYTDLILPSNEGPLVLSRTNGASSPPAFSCGLLNTPSNVVDGPQQSVDNSNDDEAEEEGKEVALSVWRNAIPFFFDLDEDGTMDVLFFSTASNASSSSTPLWGYWNGLVESENYFFTATTLNGVINNANGPSQLGAIHRFQWQDIHTNVRTGGAVQFSLTHGHALGNPRPHYGLGRTFGYIQNFATGIHFTSSASSSSSFSTVPEGEGLRLLVSKHVSSSVIRTIPTASSAVGLSAAATSTSFLFDSDTNAPQRHATEHIPLLQEEEGEEEEKPASPYLGASPSSSSSSSSSVVASSFPAIGAQSVHYTWDTYLIPNSQVVITPYPLTKPSEWSIRLFLSALKYQTLLLISLGVILAVLGVPIVVLKVMEVREDARELKKIH